MVYLHVDPACMTDGYIDMRKLDPVGRLNGFFYATLGEILEREFRRRPAALTVLSPFPGCSVQRPLETAYVITNPRVS